MTKVYATVAALRAQLADALDHAERGDTVEVERHGRRFLLVAAPEVRRTSPSRPWFELNDDALLESGWTWNHDDGDLRLEVGSRKARARKPAKRRTP